MVYHPSTSQLNLSHLYKGNHAIHPRFLEKNRTSLRGFHSSTSHLNLSHLCHCPGFLSQVAACLKLRRGLVKLTMCSAVGLDERLKKKKKNQVAAYDVGSGLCSQHHQTH